MEELISRIVDAVGVDADKAQGAVGAILGFLQKEGPSDKISEMMAAMPGAQELVDAAGGDGGGLLGGLMGGGVMGLGQQLMGMGLGMGEITGISKETIAFAKEKAGDGPIDEVIAAIPGLSQFV
ncbi:MAG: DUF2780 domain-containing protein [Pseudomonadota bacterium]